MTDAGWLTFDQFAGRVGESFVVAGDDSTSIATELVEATESDVAGGANPDGTERHQFSLYFRGPVEPILPQATYRLEHAELGSMDLFLVPIGPDADGMRYQAAFA